MSRVPVDHARGEELRYLDGLAAGRVLYQHCEECGAAVWYLRTVCPVCMSAELREHASAGTGTVHTLTTLHRAGHPQRIDDVPYTVALVELDEGVRVIGDLAPGIGIGDRVTARPHPDGLSFDALDKAAR